MSDLKKNMTKVVPLKSKKNSVGNLDEKSKVKSSLKKANLKSAEDNSVIVPLEILDPKLKSIQEAIDKGLYKIPSHMITESFLEKSDGDTSSINKNTPKSISAANVGRKLEILKKNKE